MWANRVIIPTDIRTSVLEMLDEKHPGISRTKMLARSYAWWPNIDENIEDTLKQCQVCQFTMNKCRPTPLQPWKLPVRNWQRVHMDFAKIEGGIQMLILFDT